MMSIETVKDTVAWLKDFRIDPVTFTFHGGEPLLAGAEFYRQALPLLTDELPHLEPNFALQTNLWKMTPELADVLAQYNIPIGSSLDGPQELNDLQRSEGYYERTMRDMNWQKSTGFRCSSYAHLPPTPSSSKKISSISSWKMILPSSCIPHSRPCEAMNLTNGRYLRKSTESFWSICWTSIWKT